MPCKHLIAPCSLPHDHRIQHTILPDALYHIFQTVSLIQPEWMIMKRKDFLNRNRDNPVHSHWRILHRILSKKIQCVLKYFSFWCISFHPQSPPLPDFGMLYKPYSPEHIPEAAHCNKLILPPLLYSV